jgi:hypothetical protein
MSILRGLSLACIGRALQKTKLCVYFDSATAYSSYNGFSMQVGPLWQGVKRQGKGIWAPADSGCSVDAAHCKDTIASSIHSHCIQCRVCLTLAACDGSIGPIISVLCFSFIEYRKQPIKELTADFSNADANAAIAAGASYVFTYISKLLSFFEG